MQEENQNQENKTIKFMCPSCGELTQDDVVFLCNTCSQEELIFQDGVYMCPACLVPGENFECFKCGSKQVKMIKHEEESKQDQ